MPTYEYLCENCQARFEKFESITATPLRKCPECGKPALKRLIGTGAGIIFKGSGFYETDYRSDNYKTAKRNEKNSGTGKKKKDSSAKSKKQTASTKASGQKSSGKKETA